jgi:Cu/Ag efflux protein CusF
MEAMTMDFPIRDAAEFSKLSVGDRIEATVFVEDVGFALAEIRVAPKGGPPPTVKD